MSLSVFKSLIRERNAKIALMERDAEPSIRIDRYREMTANIIRGDYVTAVSKAIDTEQARKKAIVDEYTRRTPTVQENANKVSVRSKELHAMSTHQLEKYAGSLTTMPAGLHDGLEMRLVACELRDRNVKDLPDNIAVFIETARCDYPYEHLAEWKNIEDRINRFTVFQKQALDGEMLVCCDTPESIGKDDIVTDMDVVK